MLMRLSGRTTLVSPEPVNACSPILVRLLGSVTLVMLTQLMKADSPMLVTGQPLVELGITTAPLEPVYPVIVTAPLLVVNVNCACSVSGKASSNCISKQLSHRFPGLCLFMSSVLRKKTRTGLPHHKPMLLEP